MAPIHPGEILKEELLIPRGISQSQLSQNLKISFRRINEICQDLQRDYELECLADQAEIAKIKKEIRPYTRERFAKVVLNPKSKLVRYICLNTTANPSECYSILRSLAT
ncbi:16641_t:CDS:2 [Funneliformis geosporum]|uniref:16641_t:CDS:1 n=1 Tax=Funneliformis geosporum TaxID=1117311 RepID=A0A9W4WHU6_9GLOM|nr:16641_t:CDS:2 [Funneliformis geosporum]